MLKLIRKLLGIDGELEEISQENLGSIDVRNSENCRDLLNWILKERIKKVYYLTANYEKGENYFNQYDFIDVGLVLELSNSKWLNWFWIEEGYNGDFEYNVYYITAHSEPQNEESELLKKVFKSISDLNDIKVEITGRADPRGNREYNNNLARERADVIREIAKESGLKEEQISVSSYVSDVKIKRNRELHFFDRNTTILIRKLK